MKSKITIFIIFSFLFIGSLYSQWVPIGGPPVNLGISALLISGNNILAGAEGYGGGIYRSTNNGQNWTQTLNQSPYFLVISGNNIFAGTCAYGIYLSTNNGQNWTQFALYGYSVHSLAILGNNNFAGTNVGVYLSTNNGQNWTLRGLNPQIVLSLAISGNNIFAGMVDSGVYVSTNNGQNWRQTALNNQTVSSFAISGNNIFAGIQQENGIYLSTNNGQNWTQTSLNNQWINSLTISGNNIFAGTFSNGVYVSTNNGQNWTQRNEGFYSNPTVLSFFIANNYIYAGTFDNSVWKRPLSDFIGIKQIFTKIPNSFSLYQNYPNPFNPSTNIRYDLPKSGFVKLVIYDVLGRVVVTLVNEKLNAGKYQIDWNASNFSSGVYFYKLTAGNFTNVKKMILIK